MKLSRVYKEICLPLESVTSRTVVIAGGAVRDHLLGRKPRDYDVFVLTGKMGAASIQKLTKDVRNYILGQPSHTGVHFPAPTTKYGALPNTSPIAEFYFWGHKVQVMGSPVGDVAGLLNTFDYNICQLAYRDYKVVHHIWKVLAVIKSHGKLCVTHTTNPVLTLSRGYDFARRYGMTLPDDVVKTLCAQIAGTVGPPTAAEISLSEALKSSHLKAPPGGWFEYGSYDKLAALILGGKL